MFSDTFHNDISAKITFHKKSCSYVVSFSQIFDDGHMLHIPIYAKSFGNGVSAEDWLLNEVSNEVFFQIKI